MVQNEVHRSLVLNGFGRLGKTKDTRLFCLQSIRVVVSGSDRKFFPCSGNGNNASWNNRGSNGNYWSASFNSAANARNLNFNSGGVNPQSHDYRFYGFAVRPVQHSSAIILYSLIYDFDKGKTVIGLIHCLLRCTQAQVNALICETLGSQSQGEYGRAVRGSDKSQIPASPIEMLHSGLSKEKGDIRSHIQRQNSTSPVLSLYTLSIRENIHSGFLQLYQGTWDTLWDKENNGLLQEGIEKLATPMLCDALRHQRLLHAHRQKETSGNLNNFSEKDVSTQNQQELTEDLAGYSRYEFPVLADGSYCHARSCKELHHSGRFIGLGWSGRSQEYAAPGKWSWSADWQPDITAFQQCISKCLRPIHEEGSEMPILWEICGRCYNCIIRQEVVAWAGTRDSEVHEGRTWYGSSYGQIKDFRGASWNRVSWGIHKALANICITTHTGESGQKDRLLGFLETDEDPTIGKQLFRHFSAYGIIQYQAQAVYEKRDTQARSLRRRTDKNKRETDIQLLTN